MIFLSVVIPAYNEELRIVASLEKIINYLKSQPYTYELIVIDDGSVDRTVEVTRPLLAQIEHGTLLQNGRNRGKGYSVRQGVKQSAGDYLLFTDADLSTPIEELEKLLPYVQHNFEIAIGSRGMQHSEVQIHQPWYREQMGKMFNRIIRALMLTDLHDTQCGFKCFRGDVARRLFAMQQIDHFSFDVEVLYLAAQSNYTIAEVPIKWYNEPNSRVNALHDSLKMFRDVLKIRYHAWQGHYRKMDGA